MSAVNWNALASTVHGVIGLGFDERPGENQAALVVREAHVRLRGMSTLLHGMAISHRQMGGHNAEQLSFLAACTADLALSLERAHAALNLACEDIANERERMAKKKGKRNA